jgi:hypothetical protein
VLFRAPCCRGPTSGRGSSLPLFLGTPNMPTVTCPSCEERMQVSRGQIGRKVKCLDCGFAFFADDGTEPVVKVQTKKKKPRLLLAAGIGVALFFCCTGMTGMLSTKVPRRDGTGDRPSDGVAVQQAAPPAQAAPSRHRKFTRAEFRQAVMGKTGEEVKQFLGEPKSSQEFGDQIIWYYEGRTVDPVSGNTDNQAQLVIEDGRVSLVSFY